MAKKSGQAASNAKSHTGLLVLGGIAAAAAASAYFIHGNKAAQQKIKKVKGWALKAKGEVLEKIEKLKAIDETLYHQAIDGVVKKYEKVKGIDLGELTAVAKEMKTQWKNIKRELQSGKKTAAKSVAKMKETGAKLSKAAAKVAKQAGDVVAK